MNTNAYIGLGSNLGKRQMALRTAISRIAQLPKTKVLKLANFRETAPVGGPAGQGAFINSAAEVETALDPASLLDALLRIERDLGRDRGAAAVANGPRTIDLDLLLYGDGVISREGLEVPHPRMHERMFVMDPLAEIAANVVHPVYGRTIDYLRQVMPTEWEVEHAGEWVRMRRASPGDLQEVLGILLDASDWLASRGIDQWKAFRTEAGEERLRKRLANEDVYIATWQGEGLGTVTIQWTDADFWGEKGRDGIAAYVHGLAVKRKGGAKGIGEKMLRWAERTMKAKGRKHSRLDCTRDSEGIRSYYRRAGYVECAEVVRFGHDVVLLEKDLHG